MRSLADRDRRTLYILIGEGNTMRELSDLLEQIRVSGYERQFHIERERFHDGSQWLRPDQARLIDTVATDSGTDPGDDATVYLIETESGRRGFVILGDGPHVAPEKAEFVDQLMRAAKDHKPNGRA